MVCPNVLVLLALAIGARIQHIDAQSIYLDVLDLPVAADYATYFAEGIRKLAVGRLCLPPCSPNTNGQFVESKMPEPLSDSSLLWNFTAFSAMTPRLSGLYRCFTSTAQSRRTDLLHAPEGSGAWIWILMLPFAAIVMCKRRLSMDSQPRLIGTEKYTMHLLVAMLIVNLPHYVHCQPCNSVFVVTLNCDVGRQDDGNFKLFYASGQEVPQLIQSLPICVLKACPHCLVPPLLTLENLDTMQTVFTSQQPNYYLEWNATEMPHLNPTHTGVYRCNASNITSNTMCNLTVVVPSSISCTRPKYLPECEVSVSCTVYGFPKPAFLWQGHMVHNITHSESSCQHGVHEYNSTAVFQLPDNLTDDTSVSISLKVYHNPPISCTVVADDSSIHERCNHASRNITESIAIRTGNRTMDNDTCADDVLTSGPITTPSPSPGPTSHGMSQSTSITTDTDTVDSLPGWVIPVAVVGGIAVIVIGIVIVLCLVKSKNNRKTPDTEPLPQAFPKSKAAAETDRQPPYVSDPSADPGNYDMFHHPDQQNTGTGPSARPDTYDQIQIQAIIKQGQQPGQQPAAATPL